MEKRHFLSKIAKNKKDRKFIKNIPSFFFVIDSESFKNAFSNENLDLEKVPYSELSGTLLLFWEKFVTDKP